MLLACDLLWSREVYSSCRKLDRSWFPPWSRWSLRSLLRSLYSSLFWYAYNFFADGTYDVFYSVTDSQLVGCRSIWKVALENLIIGSVYGATKISRMQKNDWSNRRLVCWQCMSTAHITWIFSIFLDYLEINRAHVLRIHSKVDLAIIHASSEIWGVHSSYFDVCARSEDRIKLSENVQTP